MVSDKITKRRLSLETKLIFEKVWNLHLCTCMYTNSDWCTNQLWNKCLTTGKLNVQLLKLYIFFSFFSIWQFSSTMTDKLYYMKWTCIICVCHDDFSCAIWKLSNLKSFHIHVSKLPAVVTLCFHLYFKC